MPYKAIMTQKTKHQYPRNYAVKSDDDPKPTNQYPKPML